MKTKNQTERVQKSAYKPASLLSELKEHCTHIENALAPLLGLEEQAKEAAESVSDCFLRLIYSSISQSEGRTVNLQTRLLDGVYKQMIPLLDPDGRTMFFSHLRSQLRDTYMTGSRKQTRLYLVDVEIICQRILNLATNLLVIEESKIADELFNVKVQQNPALNAHYIQSLPMLIHIAKGSICLFKPYRLYFTEVFIVIREFLELIYANQTITPKTRRAPSAPSVPTAV